MHRPLEGFRQGDTGRETQGRQGLHKEYRRREYLPQGHKQKAGAKNNLLLQKEGKPFSQFKLDIQLPK